MGEERMTFSNSRTPGDIAAACALVLLMASSVNAAGVQAESAIQPAIPSKKTVQSWWKDHTDEQMTIEGDLLEVRLKNLEVAYMAPVSFFSRGRNDIWHMVLVRPKLRAVREIEFPMRSAVVRDVDHDGISEVVTTQIASGQGTSVVIDSIVHIDGWKPKVLHQAKSGDNLGACMPAAPTPCRSVKVDWQFQDATENGVAILIETITTSEGASPEETSHRKNRTVAPPASAHETVRSTVNRYSFTGERFVRKKEAAK
jgi:hypothetical protein